MHRLRFILIAMVCVGMSYSVVFAQDKAANGAVQPRFEIFNPLKGARVLDVQLHPEMPREMIEAAITERVASLFPRVAENIGQRYGLDAESIETMRLSILESVKTAVKQDEDVAALAKIPNASNTTLLAVLLSYPGCKAAFAEYLNEAQLQDYVDFTQARQHRDRQAVARRITVALDKELSLTPAQREQFLQLLPDAIANEGFPDAMHMLNRMDSHGVAVLVRHRFKFPLTDILSEAQAKVWKELSTPDITIKHVFRFDMPEVRVKGAHRVDKIDKIDERAFVIEPIRPLDNQEWVEIKGPAVPDERRMAEAKLMAHTELLGVLDERAAKRLKLVTKGVVQRYFEAQDESRERISEQLEVDFMRKVEAGEMTREQAAARLQGMRNNLWNAGDSNKGRESTASDITKDPLYQQTIKDVLSEEAFARYKAYQAEREALRQQALRDIVVACMDTQMLLDDTQREQLETAASGLAPTPYGGSQPAEFRVLQRFRRATNFEILTPWQQGEFDRVFDQMLER